MCVTVYMRSYTTTKTIYVMEISYLIWYCFYWIFSIHIHLHLHICFIYVYSENVLCEWNGNRYVVVIYTNLVTRWHICLCTRNMKREKWYRWVDTVYKSKENNFKKKMIVKTSVYRYDGFWKWLRWSSWEICESFWKNG